MISTKATSNLLFAWRNRPKHKNHRQACVLMTTLIIGLMLMNQEAAAKEAGRTTSVLTCNINGNLFRKGRVTGSSSRCSDMRYRKGVSCRMAMPSGWTPSKLALITWPNGSSWNGNAVRSSGSKSAGPHRTGPYGSTLAGLKASKS